MKYGLLALLVVAAHGLKSAARGGCFPRRGLRGLWDMSRELLGRGHRAIHSVPSIPRGLLTGSIIGAAPTRVGTFRKPYQLSSEPIETKAGGGTQHLLNHQFQY